MIAVQWHSAALAEAERAHDYYLERNPVAAEQFRVELDRAIAQIEERPERWRLLADGTRRCRFRYFPYSIV
jgi:plasmid stabilization system protein ParE